MGLVVVAFVIKLFVNGGRKVTGLVFTGLSSMVFVLTVILLICLSCKKYPDYIIEDERAFEKEHNCCIDFQTDDEGKYKLCQCQQPMDQDGKYTWCDKCRLGQDTDALAALGAGFAMYGELLCELVILFCFIAFTVLLFLCSAKLGENGFSLLPN
ncbi:hypothetical protein EIN_209070 [Entamoeba invadens IP1]|uniref:Uncharacterized protein n=1 Tax=Entamoeba invadens IP1 TaxID=370355 RepID=L7FP37_ENTIV|nr:hypothetical protein EIN_209070 [Entamoeba invadens IP1]ELP94508.1 hypothetical protein EIN_209070 [Entamoeba invadens IP1]|eukprot:XP_004261279.1 hypothetical protein EIN_209070 [Entamoeba invadens IP1]